MCVSCDEDAISVKIQFNDERISNAKVDILYHLWNDEVHKNKLSKCVGGCLILQIEFLGKFTLTFEIEV